MQFDAIKALVTEPFHAVDRVLLSCFHSKASIINELGHYIIEAGGKRLRPLVCLLISRCFGYFGQEDINLAAVIELIHTATLLHDDVVDNSVLRRGRETANQVFGNEAAVLVGDYLYSKAFELMVKLNIPAVMETMVETTNMMAEGEALQLLDKHNPETTEGRYLGIIQAKTGKLFETAATFGALIAKAPAPLLKFARLYGFHLGVAFQLIDDLLDYRGKEKRLGKGIGTDLGEGKVTLPLIYILENASPQDTQILREAIRSGNLEHLALIQKMIESTGALEYTIRFARTEVERAQKALSHLPASPFREGAIALAQFALERNH